MPLPYTRPDARRTRLFTSLALLSLALVISGCSKVPRRYTCHRAVGPIAIDGKLSEDAWTHASWTDRFVDIEGTHKPRPRLDTKVKMLWDDQFLYIGAWLAEPHVCAYLQDHDLIVYHDNDFEVFIDPNGDAQEYYEIEVNALNTIFDLLLVKTYIEGGPALHDWDLKGLESAVHVEGTLNNAKDVDKGWAVEFAMPWASLAEYAHKPAPPHDGDVWRVNFSRVQWPYKIRGMHYEKMPSATENNWVWSPQGTINMHLPQHWGYVEFKTKPN